MTSVEANDQGKLGGRLASRNPVLQEAAIRVREDIGRSGGMLGFDRLKIVHVDDSEVPGVSCGTEEKSADLQAAPGQRLKPLMDCHSEAAYDIQAEADRYGLSRDFPNKPAVLDGWRHDTSIFHRTHLE
jgi:hypothetical protein